MVPLKRSWRPLTLSRRQCYAEKVTGQGVEGFDARPAPFWQLEGFGGLECKSQVVLPSSTALLRHERQQHQAFPLVTCQRHMVR